MLQVFACSAQQKRLQEGHHLVHAARKMLLRFRFGHEPSGRSGTKVLVVEPIGRNHQDIIGQRLDLSLRGLHRFSTDQCVTKLLHGVSLVAKDDIEVRSQPGIPHDQVVQVSIQEAILPDALEHEVQIEPHVFQRAFGVADCSRADIDRLLEIRKKMLNNLILVTEVVVKIPRADVQFISNMARCYVAFSIGVEEREADSQYSFACTR